MSELLLVAAALARAAREKLVAVLATVVRTEGSTYRRIGARMVALPDGSYVGGVSAGCIEADVLLRAERVRCKGRAELATYDTRSAEDLIWGSGAGCGGMSQLLLEPLDPGSAAAKAERLRDVAELRRYGVLATVIRASGISLEAGDQAVLPDVGADLSGFDDVPVGMRAVIEAAARHRLRVRSSSAEVHVWPGAELDIAYEVRPPRLHFCVCGAGPDTVPLLTLSTSMGWHVTLIDHRTGAPPESWADDLDAAVVMSHKYERDLAYVGNLLAAGVSYIGVLGPRRRTLRMLDDLRLSETDTEGLYAPVGLDIGAETPEEIALAIVAEVQAVRAGRRARPLRERSGAIHDASLAIGTP